MTTGDNDYTNVVKDDVNPLESKDSKIDLRKEKTVENFDEYRTIGAFNDLVIFDDLCNQFSKNGWTPNAQMNSISHNLEILFTQQWVKKAKHNKKEKIVQVNITNERLYTEKVKQQWSDDEQ